MHIATCTLLYFVTWTFLYLIFFESSILNDSFRPLSCLVSSFFFNLPCDSTKILAAYWRPKIVAALVC